MTITFLVPFPDGAILEVVQSLAGKPVINRLWLLNRQPPTTQAQVDALAAAAASYWIANMLPLQGNDLTLALVRATSWDDPQSVLTGFVTPGLSGGVVEQTHSASVAIRLTFQAFSGSVVHRNGNFFGGLPESAVSTNMIEPSYAENLWEAYVGIIDAAPVWGIFPAWRWVCASLVDGGVLRAEVLADRTDHVIINSPYISPQRRRLRV